MEITIATATRPSCTHQLLEGLESNRGSRGRHCQLSTLAHSDHHHHNTGCGGCAQIPPPSPCRQNSLSHPRASTAVRRMRPSLPLYRLCLSQIRQYSLLRSIPQLPTDGTLRKRIDDSVLVVPDAALPFSTPGRSTSSPRSSNGNERAGCAPIKPFRNHRTAPLLCPFPSLRAFPPFQQNQPSDAWSSTSSASSHPVSRNSSQPRASPVRPRTAPIKTAKYRTVSLGGLTQHVTAEMCTARPS